MEHLSVNSLNLLNLPKLKINRKGIINLKELDLALKETPNFLEIGAIGLKPEQAGRIKEELAKERIAMEEGLRLIREPMILNEEESKTFSFQKFLLSEQLDPYKPLNFAFGNSDTFLDQIFRPGQIIEISGASGSGKTTFCSQLCMNIQLSLREGGKEGEALYIDTEGSFCPQTLRHMGTYLDKFRIPSSRRGKSIPKIPFTPINIEKIHYVRILDDEQQTSLLQSLEHTLDKYPNIKLIVWDSISVHYKNTDKFYEKIQIIGEQMQKLREIIWQRELILVIVNIQSNSFKVEGELYVDTDFKDFFHQYVDSRVLLKEKMYGDFRQFAAYSIKTIFGHDYQLEVPFKISEECGIVLLPSNIK